MATNKDNKDNGVKETRKEYIELGTRDPDVIFKDKGILIFHHAAPLTKNELLRILSDSYFAILWILEDSSWAMSESRLSEGFYFAFFFIISSCYRPVGVLRGA